MSMKYHYQYVSKSSVRIELIPEDLKEKMLIEAITGQENDNELLKQYYQIGLDNYSNGHSLTKINFMAFPKVALCSFSQQNKTENVA